VDDCITAVRRCYKCEATKPESEFNWANRAEGRRQDMCRACFSVYNQARYAANKYEIRGRVTAYKAANPVRALRSRLLIAEREPSPRRAYRAVEQALIAGVLVRPSHCSECGCHEAEHRVEAHHHDYSLPLDVRWLCTPCHRAVHRGLIE